MSSRVARKVPVHDFGTSFYLRLIGLSFTVGACMEGFMIKTGFYEKVTAIEAERREALSEPPAWVAELQQKRAKEDGTSAPKARRT